MGGGEGREGDWECSGCRNRNYAFRSFCNRCKQPRLLVDIETPPDSKWLPRIGDWICAGCTNNNYASREKCKKCGQAKEVSAIPALAIPGASLPTHPQYFPRPLGGQEQNLNLALLGASTLQHSLPLSSSWLLGGADKFGVQSASTWPLGGNPSNGVYANQVNQAVVPKGWRNGDWICTCGFHNYSSRAECKKCNASMPPALGTKRLASDDLVHDWESKRLNSGHTYQTVEQRVSSASNQAINPYPSYPAGSLIPNPPLQVNMQLPQIVSIPTLPGKGNLGHKEAA